MRKTTRQAFIAIAEHFGSETKAARKLKVDPSTLSKWYERDNIPPARCMQLHKLSKGAIPLHVLNPRLYPKPDA